MRKKIGKFLARSLTGQEFLIIEFVDILDASTMGNTDCVAEGLKSFFTLDGMRVNMHDADTFEIVELDLKVHRIK